MSRKKIFLISVIIVVVAAILFGRHLDLEYRRLIASTQSAPQLIEESIIAHYEQKLVSDFNAKDIDLAIVSRAGQERKRLPDGVLYTHSAFFLRNETGGYDVYNLYHGEKNRRISSLLADKPMDFLKPMRAHDVGIIVPEPTLQTELKTYITSKQYGQLHQPKYSLISNPFDTNFQNCNEFILDELAGFVWQISDRSEIKERLKKTIQATEIKAGFVRRYIAPFVDERLIMADHDKSIRTTTRTDLQAFLQTEGLLSSAYVMDFKSDPAP